MVFVSKKLNKKRAGQAAVVNANGNGMMNANGMFNARNGVVDADLIQGANVNFNIGDLNDAAQTAEALAAEASNAVDLGDIDAAGIFTSVAQDPEGNSFLTAQFGNGGQLALQLPAAVEEEADICEFPAQALQLRRDVNITNTTPQLVDVQTDVCGNIISYTETMTRNMVAGPWVPVSGLDAGVNGVLDLAVNGQGRVVAERNNNIRLANSLSQPNFGNGVNVSVNENVRVGKKKAPNHNVNAAYGAAMMRKFKSA